MEEGGREGGRLRLLLDNVQKKDAFFLMASLTLLAAIGVKVAGNTTVG